MKTDIDRLNIRVLVKRIITVIVVLMLLLLTVVGVISSDFNNIKKFDAKSKNSKNQYQQTKSTVHSNANDMIIQVNSDNDIANLGEFVFNIAGDKKLIADISVKYKSYKKKFLFFSNNEDIQRELVQKSAILRDATIDTMIGSTNASASNQQMRQDLRKNISDNLAEGEIEEVYFNKFIIQ